MKRKLRYLITGGTGFLGQAVVQLLKNEAEVVDIISRSGQGGQVKGDLSRWQGGVDLERLKVKNFDVFIHLAGLYDLKANQADLHIQNVVGTRFALQIASALNIPLFINASSIAAAANQKKYITTAYDLNFSLSFPDAYSESKALAEQLIKNYFGSINLLLNLRLGILVGDSVEGKILRLDGPYSVRDKLEKTKKWLKHWPLPLLVPGKPEVRMPFVPVDQAAKAIVQMSLWGSQTSEMGYKSFNLVPENGLSVAEFYKSLLQQLGLGKLRLKYIKNIPTNIVTKVSAATLNLPKEQLRYALDLPIFESASTRDILGQKWCSEFSEYENTFWRGYEKFISNR